MKKAVILGITGSLGKEIAKGLYDKGYEIIGTYHSDYPKDDFYSQNNIRLIQLSLDDRKSVDSFYDKVKDIDGIDFLTNTIANTLTFNRFAKIDIKTFEEDIIVNCVNYIYLMQKLLKKFKDGANIVFILTEMVIGEPPACFSSYVISKYALLGFMKSLAAELKPKNIKVNSVFPGMMDTKFISGLPPFIKENYKQTKKLAIPSEVAYNILKI